MPEAPDIKKIPWWSVEHRNSIVPRMLGVLALMAGATALAQATAGKEQPAKLNIAPSHAPQPAYGSPMKMLSHPMFLWNDYRRKNGMDVYVENGAGVDCKTKSLIDREGEHLSWPFAQADKWPGFRFQDGTSNFGEFRNGDRLLFLGRQSVAGNDGNFFLTDGWAIEYYKASSKYQVFHFIVKKAADLHLPAAGSAPAQNLPRANAFADAESPLLSRQDLQNGLYYNDINTSLWAKLEVWDAFKKDPYQGHGKIDEPHFTVACNSVVTPRPTTVSYER